MWLNSHNLNVRCVRIKPYFDNGRTLIDVQQIIPLPEAIEYQIQIREKEQKVRQDKSSGTQGLRRSFWESLLIRAEQKTALHANISPAMHIGWGQDLECAALHTTTLFIITGAPSIFIWTEEQAKAQRIKESLIQYTLPRMKLKKRLEHRLSG